MSGRGRQRADDGIVMKHRRHNWQDGQGHWQHGHRRGARIILTGFAVRAAAFAAVGLLCGCSQDSTGDLPRTSLEWERSAWGLTGRSIVKCPTGDCLILHYQPTERWLDSGHAPSEKQLGLLLAAPPGGGADECSIMVPGERWGGRFADENTLATCNCCSYAVGDLLDLGPGDWIDTVPHPEAGVAAPFQVVLDSYFLPVTTIRVGESPIEELDRSERIREDDLICFVQNYEFLRQFIHVGRVRKRNGRTWVESKVGSGPIVLSTAVQTAAAYSRKTDEIVIYREHGSL